MKGGLERALVNRTADLALAVAAKAEPGDVAGIVTAIRAALAGAAPVAKAPKPPKAEAPPKLLSAPEPKQLTPEEIAATIQGPTMTCLECGAHKVMLKSHLRQVHKLTTDEYRAKWGLPASYPMLAPDQRAAMAQRSKATGNLPAGGGKRKA